MSTGPSTVEPAPTDADPRLKQLHAQLKRVEMRLRLQDGVGLFPWVVTVAASTFVVLEALRRFWGALDLNTLVIAGLGLLVASLAGTALYSLLKPRELFSTARHADRALRLDERLSTAVEDAAQPPAKLTSASIALRDAQLDDALQSIKEVRPERDLPVRLKARAFIPLGVLAVVWFAVAFVPDFATNSVDQAAKAQVATEQKNVEILKQAIEAQPNAAQDPNLQKLLQELSSLSNDLKQGDLTKEEAIARLSQTEADLQKALDPATAAQREALDQLAKQLAASGNQDARQAADALKAGDTQKAVDALKKAADNASKMSPEERKALADSLQQARDSVASLDPNLASSLNDAANALQNSDPAAAKQALDNLAQQVQDNGEKVATQQQIQQALAQIQQSKTNIAQSGQATPVAGAGTAVANSTPSSGTPSSGTAVAGGTALAGTPLVVAQVSPVSGTPVTLGSATRVVVSGTVSSTGTPVLVMGTPGDGTPVASQNPGQGQQGQGQGQQGQGQTQGQGQQGQNPGQGQSGNGGQSDAPSGGWGTGHQEQVYAPPSSVQANLTPITLQGQDNLNGEQSSTTTNTDANKTGSATVPYEQIYGQYQQQAGNALNSDYIPQGYKDLVKEYFTNIAP
jgi:hypothetical protein